MRAEDDRIDLLFSHYDKVTHYLSVFDMHPEDVEDAVQDTFIEALKNLKQLRDTDKIEFWLLKIAKRVAISRMTKNKKQGNTEGSIADFAETLTPVSLICEDNSMDDLLAQADRAELKALISRLSEKEQKVLLLQFVYGYKLKDIARVIGESDTNTRSISKRGRDKLRAMIEKEDIDLRR